MKKAVAILMLAIMLLMTACTQAKPEETAPKVVEAAAQITVKLGLATDKITLEQDISHLPEGTLSVSGAKGESEGGQFILQASADVKQYGVTVSDLTGESGTIGAAAVRVMKQIYAYCEPVSGSNVLPAGSYPDALIPVEYIEKAGENTLEAGKNQGFFVDVRIPEDAAAGVYSGEITVDADGQQICIPLEVEVFDFTIASVPYTKSCYLIWQDWLVYGELDCTDEMYMTYYDTMLEEYNIQGYTFPHDTAETFIRYVRAYYDRINCFGIPYDPLSNTTNDWDKFDEYMYALAVACEEDGINYFDKAYYYFDKFYDEYNWIEWRRTVVGTVLKECDRHEELLIERLTSEGRIPDGNSAMAQTIRNMSHVIPGPASDSKLEQYAIAFCPDISMVDDSAEMANYVDSMTEKGLDTWMYNTITMLSYPYPDKALNGYLVSQRDHYWSNYVQGMTGDLYWCINGFCTWKHGTKDSMLEYSTLQDLYTTAVHDNDTNGDGYFLYPGMPYGSDRPFGGLRLIAIRDGIDDNTYMGMLGDRYAALGQTYGVAVSDAKSLVEFLNNALIGRLASKLQDEKLFDNRKALAKAITLAEQNGAVFESIYVSGNEIRYSLYTDGETELAVNGSDVTCDTVNGGKHWQGAVPLSADQTVTFTFRKAGKTEEMKMHTVRPGTALNTFDEKPNLKMCSVYKDYGTSVELDSSFAVSGASMKVTVRGWDFGNEKNNAEFRPKMSFDLTGADVKLSQISGLEMWVYNSSAVDVTCRISLDGISDAGDKLSKTYDTVLLRAGKWNKVSVDNLPYLRLTDENLDSYTTLTLSVANDRSRVLTFYVDELYLRVKGGA